jgi:twitching motility protein PilT
MASLPELLKIMLEKDASDLHITVGSPPQIRVDGSLVALHMEPLSPIETKHMCYSVLTEAQKKRFEENNELDLSFGIKDLSRFRANMFVQRGTVAGAFRTIPYSIRSFQELGLPPIVKELTKKPRGLILVTGPTGSGKTTTLAAMIDEINTTRPEHIVTIEDPIEYVHPHKKGIVNQREVGADTDSFMKALKHILRQDPDVVLVGEMRDLETMEAALTIAETGHLALATLHTNSCVQTINRIIDVFPPFQQPQVRAQLSMVLEGVLSQILLPRSGGKGRVLALEIMVPNPAIRNLIREEKIHQIYSQMQMGQSKFEMQTMNQSLCDLYFRKMIGYEDALARSSAPDELNEMIAGKEPPMEARTPSQGTQGARYQAKTRYGNR